MGKGYNDLVEGSAEKVGPCSKEYPSVRTAEQPDSQKTSSSTEKRDEKVENCVVWTDRILKAARIGKFTQEFREYKDYTPPGTNSTVSEKMADKNRYNHIFCADENRVVLKERDADNDYIHASWMEMPDKVQFISTQGPKKSTIADFWHMVYTEKCPVIVMLCRFREENQDKCERYFPDSNEKEFGEYKVKVVEKTTDLFEPVRYTVFEVQSKNTKHLVHHYWYQDWHDQVAPLDPSPLVKLYAVVLKKANNKPIVVHCSAGIGRTSTFIGIHLGFCMIRESRSVKMTEIMKKLRKMRLGSIQSQLQYVFLVVCIIQLFIDEKYIKREAKFELLLKKYSAVTGKVTRAIRNAEAQKRGKDKEDKEADTPSKDEKKESEVQPKGKREVASKKPKKEKEEPTERAKQVNEEHLSKFVKPKEASRADKRSDPARKDPSVMARGTPTTCTDRSRFQRKKTKKSNKKSTMQKIA